MINKHIKYKSNEMEYLPCFTWQKWKEIINFHHWVGCSLYTGIDEGRFGNIP